MVFRLEVMFLFRDIVCFIYSDKGDVYLLEKFYVFVFGKGFGSNEE